MFAQSCLTHDGEVKHEPTAKKIFFRHSPAEFGSRRERCILVNRRARGPGSLRSTSSCSRAFTGYEVISRVPVILHTPLMSGSNFVHGIVLVGAMVALGAASTTLGARDRLHRRGAGGG